MGDRDEGIAVARRIARRGYTPHYMHVCEKRGVAKWAMRKCMKRKSADDGGRCGGMSFRTGRKGPHPHVFSPLIAPFTREDISVASKELTRTMCWRESNWVGWAGIGREAARRDPSARDARSG